MANPNIINSTSLTGKSTVVNLTTTNATGIVTNAANSNEIIRINCLRVTNYEGQNSSDITVSIYDANSTTLGYLAYTINIVGDTALNLIDKTETVYLEEGDFIQATSSAIDRLSLYCSYEVIR